MGNSKLTLIGFYNYDNSILDNFALPSDWDSSEIDDFKMNLLMEAGEFEVLYSNFDFMKTMIGNWSRSHLPNWEKLLDTMNADFDPLSDINIRRRLNRQETRDLSYGDTETRDLDSSNTETRNLTGSIADTGSREGTSETEYDSQNKSDETRNYSGSDLRTDNTHQYDNNTKNLLTETEDNGTVTTQSSSNGTKTTSGRAFNTDSAVNPSLIDKERVTDSESRSSTETKDLDGSSHTTGTDNHV